MQRTAATASVLRGAPKKPGAFRYSNLGYAIVGAAIDRLAGMSFEDALQQYLLDPLDMASAGIGPPPRVRGHQPRVRIGYAIVGRGSPADKPTAKKPADNPALLTPAGRLHLSLPDWAKFLRVFLNNGAPLVSSQTIDHLLFDPGAGAGRRSMSMGWGDGTELGGTHAAQGSNTLWAATALLDRSNGRAAAVATNDGRMSVIVGSAHLASAVLGLSGDLP